MPPKRKRKTDPPQRQFYDEQFIENLNIGWRLTNKDKECFKVPEFPIDEECVTFNINGHPSLLQIFQLFVTNELLQSILNAISPQGNGIKCGKRKSTKICDNELDTVRYDKFFYPTISKLKQKLAYEIRIIGLQKKSDEIQPGILAAIKECIHHFSNLQNNFSKTTLSRHDFMILNTQCIWTADRVKYLNKSFQKIISKLGQYVIGNEKIFHFPGQGESLRLEICNLPQSYGQHFYELCVQCKNGNVFCLYIKLHDNHNGILSVNEVVSEWNDIIQQTSTLEKCNKTFLIKNSYFWSEQSKYCLESSNTNFSSSVTKDRVTTEYSTLENLYREIPGNESKTLDKLLPHEYVSMYNDISNDLFTVYRDSRQGVNVGLQINYSHGLKLITDINQVNKMKTTIPGYSIYKKNIETSDRFNRNLHDKYWPLKRGGCGTKGDGLNQHDLTMAVILQNVFSLYNEFNDIQDATKDEEINWTYSRTDKINPERVQAFSEKCLILSDLLFLDSLASPED